MSSAGDQNIPSTEDAAAIQPLTDGDTSIEPDPAADPAQVEWDRTTALDKGADPADFDDATATGDDPAQIPADDDDIPSFDRPGTGVQAETQGTDPLHAELGDEGQGDLAPEDL